MGREDVLRQSMQNISLVQNEAELAQALSSIEAADNVKVVQQSSQSKMTEQLMEQKNVDDEVEKSERTVIGPMGGGVLEATIAPAVEALPQHHDEKEVRDEKEKKAALEALANELSEDDFKLPDTIGPADNKEGDGNRCDHY